MGHFARRGSLSFAWRTVPIGAVVNLRYLFVVNFDVFVSMSM